MKSDRHSSDPSSVPENASANADDVTDMDRGIEQWLRDRPASSAVVTDIVTRMTNDDVPAPDAQRVLNALRQRMHGGDSTPASAYPGAGAYTHPGVTEHTSTRSAVASATQTLPRTFIRRYSVAVAAFATVALAVVGTVTALRARSTTPTPQAIYATPNGQRATITLPDGSTVALNAASRLEIPFDFNARHRTIRLTGEAVFDVAHRDAIPFIVVTDHSTTRVLGTRFAVRDYASDTSATVAVESGEVAVENVVVTRSQQATVSHAGLVRLSSVQGSPFSFASGILAIDGVPLAQAIPDLERWSDIELRLADPALGHRDLTGKFATGSVADFAAILTMTFHARVVRDGRVITLYTK